MEQVISPPQEFSHVMGSTALKSQELSEETLFWLNLENSKQTTSPTRSTSSREVVSSSSSSLNSFDPESNDHKHALSTFYDTCNAASNSSLATLVQKLSESTTTLNLDHNITKSQQPSREFQTPPSTKSALKLPSLARSRSMPDANVAVKTVRFSNDLTRVKTFNEHAKPSSISLDNSPEASPSASHDDIVSYSGVSRKAFFDFQNTVSSGSSSSSSDEEDDYFNHKSRSQFSKWTFKPLNFDLFLIRNLVDKPVKLSSLQIVNNHSIRGTVEVSNLAFEKYVEIKFSNDNWNSIYLVTGKYERSLNSLKDQFTFDINLSKSLLMKSHKNSSNYEQVNVALCIKYVSGGCNEFYDNNNSQNYQVQLINKPRQRKLKDRMLNSTKQNSHISNNFASSSNSSSTSSSSTSTSSSVPSTSASHKNFTTSSGPTRYFSDDTDYFNTQSVNHPKFSDWLKSSSVNYCSTSTPSTTPSTLSPPSSSSSSSTNDLITTFAPKPERSFDVLKTTGGERDSKDEKYNAFLKKYCFFKADDFKESDHSMKNNEPFFIR